MTDFETATVYVIRAAARAARVEYGKVRAKVSLN